MKANAVFFLAGILGATLAGCSTTPLWDARFGEPVRIIAAQQVVSPDASLNADPVKGIDGKAAQAAIGEYHKSFTQPEPQSNVFTIGVGGASAR